MPHKNIHLTYSKKDQEWQVKKSKNKEVLASSKTKKEAEKLARQIAKEEKAELVIHNKDGKISDKDSYGNESKVKDKVN